MKEFDFIDVLEHLRGKNLKRTSQLFFISLIAHYWEKQRTRGGETLGINMDAEKASYKVTLSDKDIHQKFKFSIDTLINIESDFRERDIPIKIKIIKVASENKEYKRYRMAPWGAKYCNYLKEYEFSVTRKKAKVIYLPVKIIYDKNLTYSEKMAIIWNISLREKLDRQPKLREIEKESGITERTIRKAKKRYPQLFMK
jgi:hypothetical protein